MCMDCMGGAQRFCEGCMERCIIDPFHIKMHFLSFGNNKTKKSLGALGEEKNRSPNLLGGKLELFFGGGGGGPPPPLDRTLLYIRP